MLDVDIHMLTSKMRPFKVVAMSENELRSIFVMRRVILRTHDQTSSFLCTSIDDLDDIYQVLLVIDVKIELVVISSAEITHHMFIPPEEHDCTYVVELVHLVEVLNLGVVACVDDGKVSDLVGDFVEHLVLSPCVFVFWVAEADYDHSFVFGHAGLVNVPG